MRRKTCRQCGKLFEYDDRGPKVYCTRDCSREFHKLSSDMQALKRVSNVTRRQCLGCDRLMSDTGSPFCSHLCRELVETSSAGRYMLASERRKAEERCREAYMEGVEWSNLEERFGNMVLKGALAGLPFRKRQAGIAARLDTRGLTGLPEEGGA